MSESDDMDLDEDDVQRELDRIDKQEGAFPTSGRSGLAAGQMVPAGVGALQSQDELALLHGIEPDAELSQ